MSIKRIIVEQYDGDSRPGEQDQRPMEYEMPTRGQSFVDGVSSSFWKNVAVGAIILACLIIWLIL